MTKEEPPAIVKDLWLIIDEDEYAWMVCWGPPRTGKSTLCLLLAYHIYKDWNKVLDCIVFNLNQLLYKLQKGIPERVPTLNGLHLRVPFLIWDDFGAHSNKAKIQHERGWDTFKGAFDTLGTKLGVLIANMVNPTEPTQQLVDKYSHELWVYKRVTANMTGLNSNRIIAVGLADSQRSGFTTLNLAKPKKTFSNSMTR